MGSVGVAGEGWEYPWFGGVVLVVLMCSGAIHIVHMIT